MEHNAIHSHGLLVGSSFAARPMDRLGLLTLLSSIYFFLMWGFALDDPGAWPASASVQIALLIMCCAGILLPRLWPVLIINSFVYALSYYAKSPVASNNQTTSFFVSVVILAGASVALVAWLRDRNIDWREALFSAISGPGRWLLAILYFWGIYHKINTDFLNPEVSCAVVLYATLAVDFDLENWRLGQYGAIYATFVIEATAMILLFSPRYKRIGMIVGIPFHIIIGWTGYAFYKDFSTIVLVMYAMFLPASALRAAVDDAARWTGSRARAASLGRAALFAGLIAFLIVAGVAGDIHRAVPTHSGFVWAFTVYALLFYAFVVFYTPWKAPGDPMWDFAIRPVWLSLVPVIFFLNGASPYLGLKTESSIAMFSNLHTEDHQTNHLLTGQLPFAASYQNDTVRILGSNSPEFDQRFANDGRTWVRYQFDALIARRPGLEVAIAHNGVTTNTAEGWTNTFTAAPKWLRKYLVFKPIDYERPKVCTH
jgi:hypothetical protein